MDQLVSDGITGHLCVDGPQQGKVLVAPAGQSAIEFSEQIEAHDWLDPTPEPTRSIVSRKRSYHLTAHPEHGAVWSLCRAPSRTAPGASD